jgi:hypothetical protein
VTKESIIRTFKQNIESFERIKKYAQNTDGVLYIDNNSGEMIVSNDKTKNNPTDPPYKIVELDELPIKADVYKIIEKLSYVGIYEEGGPLLNGIIIFSRTIGSEEQGILYTKDKSIKYGMKMEKIMDGWYYYWIGYV